MVKLTDHELEVLGHLAQGYNQKETAKQMKLSPQEVNNLVNCIRKKRRSLEKAMEWYREQNQDKFAVDELPDEDEPAGQVMRCSKCGLVEPHRCLKGSDHLCRDHETTGIAGTVTVGGGRHTDYLGGNFKSSEEPLLTSSQGRGRR